MSRSRVIKLKWMAFAIALGVLLVDLFFVGPERLALLVSQYDRGAFPRRLVYEKTYVPLDAKTIVTVDVRNVTVDVKFSDAAESVEVQLEGELPPIGNESHLSTRSSTSTLKVAVREDPKSFWVRHFPNVTGSSTRLTVTLPRRFSGELSVRTLAGAVSLAKASLAKFEFRSRSGTMDVSDSDVHVLRVETDSGLVFFEGRSQDVAIESKSGEVKTAFRDAPETGRSNLQFRTHSGDVEIEVHPKASLAVQLESLSGLVESNLAFDGKVERSERKVVGAVNEGHGTLDAKTWSGKIRLDGAKN